MKCKKRVKKFKRRFPASSSASSAVIIGIPICNYRDEYESQSSSTGPLPEPIPQWSLGQHPNQDLRWVDVGKRMSLLNGESFGEKFWNEEEKDAMRALLSLSQQEPLLPSTNKENKSVAPSDSSGATAEMSSEKDDLSLMTGRDRPSYRSKPILIQALMFLDELSSHPMNKSVRDIQAKCEKIQAKIKNYVKSFEESDTTTTESSSEGSADTGTGKKGDQQDELHGLESAICDIINGDEKAGSEKLDAILSELDLSGSDASTHTSEEDSPNQNE